MKSITETGSSVPQASTKLMLLEEKRSACGCLSFIAVIAALFMAFLLLLSTDIQPQEIIELAKQLKITQIADSIHVEVGDDGFPFLIFLLISLAVLIFSFSRWIYLFRGFQTYFGRKRKYIKLQKAYVKARKEAQNPTQNWQPYEKLPVFPLPTPYWADLEKSSDKYQLSTSDSLEDFLNDALNQIRNKTPDSLFMRGKEHAASGTAAKVLLIVEEIEQSDGELAIIAVVFQKRGMLVSYDVRYSAWPNTIHLTTPRRNLYAKASDNWCVNWSSLEKELFYYYFSPIGWTHEGDVVPEFDKETISSAELFARAVHGVLKKWSDENYEP